MQQNRKKLRNNIVLTIVVTAAVLAIVGSISGARLFAQDTLESVARSDISEEGATVAKFAFIGAAVAFGLGALGAGLAIGNVGAAAMGAVAEKPEVAGQALIFVALAEGLVIFGFITALMILGKV
jgi:V/A-type H+-transporting ATPase subunit K